MDTPRRKELTVSIATWLKQRNARDREELIEKGREEGRKEGYVLGYGDAESGRPPQMGERAVNRTGRRARRRSRRPLQ